jgi:hypothetical protein
LETGLATYFQRLTQMHEVSARRVFYSIGGFDGRKRALMAVIGWVKTQPDITPYLNKIVGRAGNYSGTRNFIVHGDVIEVGYPGSKYYGQVIILQGRQPWVADPPDAEVMTVEQLVMARENFAILAGCVHRGLNWEGKDAAQSPLAMIELIDALPPEAHMTKLDQNIAAKFLPVASTIHHWR